MMTTKSFVRHAVLNMLIDTIKSSVPENMLKLNNTEQRV